MANPYISKTPFLSVVTAVLNAKDTIQNTIDSVRDQNYEDFEYLIIDGGSTDGTLEILKNNTDSIDYISSGVDTGIYDAMNKGVLAAKGKVIYFLGADDILADTNILSEVMGEYIRKGVDVLYGKVEFKTKKGILATKGWNPKLLDFKLGFTPPHQAVFMGRQKLVDEGMFRSDMYRLAADFDMYCRFSLRGLKSGYIDMVIAMFGNNGQSSKFKELIYKESAQVIKSHFGLGWSVIYKMRKGIRKCLQLVLDGNK